MMISRATLAFSFLAISFSFLGSPLHAQPRGGGNGGDAFIAMLEEGRLLAIEMIKLVEAQTFLASEVSDRAKLIFQKECVKSKNLLAKLQELQAVPFGGEWEEIQKYFGKDTDYRPGDPLIDEHGGDPIPVQALSLSNSDKLVLVDRRWEARTGNAVTVFVIADLLTHEAFHKLGYGYEDEQTLWSVAVQIRRSLPQTIEPHAGEAFRNTEERVAPTGGAGLEPDTSADRGEGDFQNVAPTGDVLEFSKEERELLSEALTRIRERIDSQTSGGARTSHSQGGNPSYSDPYYQMFLQPGQIPYQEIFAAIDLAAPFRRKIYEQHAARLNALTPNEHGVYQLRYRGETFEEVVAYREALKKIYGPHTGLRLETSSSEISHRRIEGGERQSVSYSQNSTKQSHRNSEYYMVAYLVVDTESGRKLQLQKLQTFQEIENLRAHIAKEVTDLHRQSQEQWEEIQERLNSHSSFTLEDRPILSISLMQMSEDDIVALLQGNRAGQLKELKRYIAQAREITQVLLTSESPETVQLFLKGLRKLHAVLKRYEVE